MNDYEYSKGELNYIATVALAQILATAGVNTFNCWGVSRKIATTCKGMPALALKVDARLFQGLLVVALNEGKDLYELYTITDASNEPKKIAEDLYSDMLGDEIDRLIERGDNWEEYEAFCKAQDKLLYQFIFS